MSHRRRSVLAVSLALSACAFAPRAGAEGSPITCVLVARGVDGAAAQPVADAVCAELAVKGAERGAYEVTVEARGGALVVAVRDPADAAAPRRVSVKTIDDALAAAPRIAEAIADGRELDDITTELAPRPSGRTTHVRLRGSSAALYGRGPAESTWKYVCTSPCERDVPTDARYRVNGANGQDELTLPPSRATVTVGSRSTPAFVLGVGAMVASSVALSAAYLGAVSATRTAEAPSWPSGSP